MANRFAYSLGAGLAVGQAPGIWPQRPAARKRGATGNLTPSPHKKKEGTTAASPNYHKYALNTPFASKLPLWWVLVAIYGLYVDLCELT